MVAPAGERQLPVSSMLEGGLYGGMNGASAGLPPQPDAMGAHPAEAPHAALSDARSVLAGIVQEADQAIDSRFTGPSVPATYAGGKPSFVPGQRTPGASVVPAADPYRRPEGRSEVHHGSGATTPRQWAAEHDQGEMPEHERIERQIHGLHAKLEQYRTELEAGRDRQLGRIDAHLDTLRQALAQKQSAKTTWTSEFVTALQETQQTILAECEAEKSRHDAKQGEVETIASQIFGAENEYADDLINFHQARSQRKLITNKQAVQERHERRWGVIQANAKKTFDHKQYEMDSEIGSIESSIRNVEAERERTTAEAAHEIQDLESTTMEQIHALESRLSALHAARRRGGMFSRARQPKTAPQAVDAPSRSVPAVQGGRSKEQRRPRRLVLVAGALALAGVAVGVGSGVFGSGQSGSTSIGANKAEFASKQVLDLEAAIDATAKDPDAPVPLAGGDSLNVLDGTMYKNDPSDDQGHPYTSIMKAIILKFPDGTYPGDASSQFTPGLIPMNTKDATNIAAQMNVKFDAKGNNDTQTELKVAAGLIDYYGYEVLNDPNNKDIFKDKATAGTKFMGAIVAKFGFDSLSTQQIEQVSLDWANGIGPSATAVQLLGSAAHTSGSK